MKHDKPTRRMLPAGAALSIHDAIRILSEAALRHAGPEAALRDGERPSPVAVREAARLERARLAAIHGRTRAIITSAAAAVAMLRGQLDARAAAPTRERPEAERPTLTLVSPARPAERRRRWPIGMACRPAAPVRCVLARGVSADHRPLAPCIFQQACPILACHKAAEEEHATKEGNR